jgi:ferredoxin--NADP+ reductase
LTIHYWSTPESIDQVDDELEIALVRGAGAERSTKRLRVDVAITATGFELTPSHCNSFALSAGALLNESGRMLDATGAVVPGLYAVGWAARGARGTIGTCRSEAERLTQLILKDALGSERGSASGAEQLRQLLNSRQHRFVNFDEWLQLDRMERAHGAATGRSRLKFRTLNQMLSSLNQTPAKSTHRAITHE